MNFGICHYLYAQDNNKLVTLTKQIIEIKTNEGLQPLFEQLKDLYFKDNKYSELVEFLESLSRKKRALEPFVNYYIALSRYYQLKYLEEKQNWDEYFNKGNIYRDQLISSLQKTIGSTDTKEPLNLYSRLLLWQFHKDQEDSFAEPALADLINAILEYSKDAPDIKPIKDIADKLLAYGEKGKSKEAYKIYIDKIVKSNIDEDKLRDIAAGFYKEGNLDLSEAIYDVYAERVAKLYPKEKSILILVEIAKDFAYKDEGQKDPIYSERVFQKIEQIGGKDIFDEELIYLRAFNLEKIKEYPSAKDRYIELITRFPQTNHADEANFKAGIIYTYILRDMKTGRDYFENLSHKETVSPQAISSLYQLGLLSQWENDLAKASDYYNKLIEKAGSAFVETTALTKERLKEINETRPIEYNLKTFLDASLKEESPAFDASRLDLKSSRYKIKKDENISISSASYNIESGCLQVEIQYLWSGHLGMAKPALEQASFNAAYTEPGTKEINLVTISPGGVIGWNIEFVDVY